MPTNIRLNALEISQVKRILETNRGTDAEMEPSKIIHRALIEGLAARVDRLIASSGASPCCAPSLPKLPHRTFRN